MRLRDRLRSQDRLTRKYRNANAYGGFHLCYETVAGLAVKSAKTGNPHIWVYGDHRKYDAGPTTPSLDGQRLDLFRWNPTATYDGWVLDTYKVYGKH